MRRGPIGRPMGDNNMLLCKYLRRETVERSGPSMARGLRILTVYNEFGSLGRVGNRNRVARLAPTARYLMAPVLFPGA